jgi:hypothetical protein
MGKWGEWWADSRLLFLWLVISLIGAELFALILRDELFNCVICGGR